MGNENSTLIDPDTPTNTLRDRSLRAVADHIRNGGGKRIVVLTGAGISTAAGTVPGKFHPTISHAFIGLLAKRKLLRMLFTQNIDCLERRAGVPGDRIVEAHGSFATQRCIDCKMPFPDDEMPAYVEKGEPPRCKDSGCGGLVKPDIVFFGEQLPSAFFDNRDVPADGDLVLILGTSLTVHPFASLPDIALRIYAAGAVQQGASGYSGPPRRRRHMLGDCDSGVRQLADELGWRDELEKMWRGLVGDEEADRQLQQTSVAREKDEEMERLVQRVADKLDISGPPADEEHTANDDGQAGITTEAPTVAAAEAKAGTASAEKGDEEDGQKEVTRQEPGEGDEPAKGPFSNRGDAAAVAGAATASGVSSSIPEEVKPKMEESPKPIASVDTDALAWERRGGATFEADKTAIIHFARKPHKAGPTPFTTKGQEVRPKEHVKILGVIMDTKLKCKEHIAEAAAKGLESRPGAETLKGALSCLITDSPLIVIIKDQNFIDAAIRKVRVWRYIVIIRGEPGPLGTTTIYHPYTEVDRRQTTGKEEPHSKSNRGRGSDAFESLWEYYSRLPYHYSGLLSVEPRTNGRADF
ncbi:hypothetical protein PG994_008311 [Apiospora phragmitis]|uniref:Deacetylase sirtuin-type domain-containing protein n=1 Tax=Apiospora phragmitis TaxID=2905665 RepID=A0ABR1USN7_9PEZI